MKNFKFKHTYLILDSVAMNTTLFGQIPHFLKVQNMWEDDSLNILYLITNGIKISD